MPHSLINLARTENREPSEAKRFAILSFPTTASGTTSRRHGRDPLDGADDKPLRSAVPNGLWRSSVSVRSADAGAFIISPFIGRVDDIGVDSPYSGTNSFRLAAVVRAAARN
jgi:hypothetical protein